MTCPGDFLEPMIRLVVASKRPLENRLHAVTALKQALCPTENLCNRAVCDRWDAEVMAGRFDDASRPASAGEVLDV